LSLLLLLAGLFGAATGAIGTLLSDDRWRALLPFDPLRFGTNNKGLPTGPLIILTGKAIFLFSLLFAPSRGLLAKALSTMRLRARVTREHLLRTMFELSEPALPKRPEIPIAALVEAHAWGAFRTWAVLTWAVRHNYVNRDRHAAHLTQSGVEEAARLTRRHRLWELYLIHGANIAPDHVDRDADDVEHVLPPEMIERLEHELAIEHPPRPIVLVPASPHEIPHVPSAATPGGTDG
jgi:manganese/zinc/iron transport system permease protein